LQRNALSGFRRRTAWLGRLRARLSLEAVTQLRDRELAQAEALGHLAQHVVGRRALVLDGFELGLDLGFDEATDHVAEG
jgi:hypothetical protein